MKNDISLLIHIILLILFMLIVSVLGKCTDDEVNVTTTTKTIDTKPIDSKSIDSKSIDSNNKINNAVTTVQPISSTVKCLCNSANRL